MAGGVRYVLSAVSRRYLEVAAIVPTTYTKESSKRNWKLLLLETVCT